MSDHLPECPGPAPCDRWDICDRLRACEKRTLAAARDAVDRMGRYGTDEMEPWDSAIGYALAAIDALRGDA